MPAVRKSICYALLTAIGLMALLAYQSFLPVGITWNRSESLPVGLYWHKKLTTAPVLGDVVCFPYKPPEWARSRVYFVEGTFLCKRVLGLPGDRIVSIGDRREICRDDGCVDVGRVKARDSSGRPATAATLPDVIPEGFAYLGIPEVPMSFDSRYLGLVALADIHRTIYPVWVWARE